MAHTSDLARILTAQRLLTPEQLREADQLSTTTRRRLGQTLIDEGFLSEDVLLRALASQHHITPWNLEDQPPTQEALTKVPVEACVRYRMLPVQVRGDLLLVAITDPTQTDYLEAARALSGMRVEPVLAYDDRLDDLLLALQQGRIVGGEVQRHVTQAMSEIGTRSPSADGITDVTEEATRPVVGIVNQILQDAIRLRASDIHIEPFGERVEVRFRVDGMLRKMQEIPTELHPMLVTRVKIMAELDVVEYRVPQDGRMTVTLGRRAIDLRVSVLPNIHGQRVVLRILDRQASLRSLSDLGFSDPNLARFRSLIHKPYGLLLVTGPTGSGKTTTLYAALQEVRTGSNNIMTCEDPVEYAIPGIAQSQVSEKIGLTFAQQLRAILRQDPDIILVGEIRDAETAETAIRASMTGHLVLSTLHCNDAIGAVPRLLDMGIDSTLLSSSLIGVTAQRLVRRLCDHCKTPTLPDEATQALFVTHLGHRVESPIFVPVGCPACHGSGYRGRVGVHEVVTVDREMEHLIGHRESADTLAAAAFRGDHQPMAGDALSRVVQGVTSLAEVSRCVFLAEDPTFLRLAA